MILVKYSYFPFPSVISYVRNMTEDYHLLDNLKEVHFSWIHLNIGA